MDYNIVKEICKVNKINLTDVAKEAGLSIDGLKRGIDNDSLSAKYIMRICKSLCITPNKLFGVPEQQTTTQTQNGGVGNTQIVEAGITALQDQLKEKDRQIARLLDIVAKQS